MTCDPWHYVTGGVTVETDFGAITIPAPAERFKTKQQFDFWWKDARAAILHKLQREESKCR